MIYELAKKVTCKGYEHVKNDECEIWLKDGEYHRLDGPAIISYDKDGNVTLEHWYKEGKNHRLDAPAVIKYDNSNVTKEQWYKDGDRHRLDGPAWIEYDENGNITEEHWCKDGERLYRENFTSLDMINQFKAYSLYTPIELVRIRNEL